jgi:hypothetical protein
MTADAAKKIFVAIPVYSHDLDFKTVISLTQAAAEAAQYNFKLQVQFRVGNSLVHKARNMLLSEFLTTDCTDLFFVDSDISWGPGTFGRMVAHPVDFVCGCYRSKSAAVHYFVKPADGVFRRDRVHGLVEVEAAPAGFMRVSRKAIEAMIAHGSQDAWFTDQTAPHIAKIWHLFEFILENHILWGEDYSFCRKYRQAGGKVWIDPDITLHHTGKMTYSGRFIDTLTRLAPKHPEFIDQDMLGQKE